MRSMILRCGVANRHATEDDGGRRIDPAARRATPPAGRGTRPEGVADIQAGRSPVR